MSIKIVLEKTKSVDGRLYKVKTIDALDFSKLPGLYLNGRPRLYATGENTAYLQFADGSSTTIFKGKTLTPEEAERIIAACRHAGERLRAINDEIRKDLEGWEGEEVYII